jgi:hypothetical protein
MYIAAGPFENLFRYHGMLMVPTIAAEAVRNERVRQALSGVWMNEEWPCYAWWVERMREYGYLRDETTPVVH